MLDCTARVAVHSVGSGADVLEEFGCHPEVSEL